MILNFIYLLSILLLSVIIHEGGHTIAALLSGVKVDAFSIGFGKPYIHKKLFGIDFRLTPWLLGGYTAIKGEYTKGKDCFLSKRYSKKFFILTAGVLMNLIAAIICYLINYKSILIGFYVDWEFLVSIFTKDYITIKYLMVLYRPNMFLLFFSIFNLTCVIFNLLPFPSLDGSLLWLVWLEKPLGKKFGSILQKVCWVGFTILMLLQIIFLFWWLK